jgi:hypothetical protein
VTEKEFDLLFKILHFLGTSIDMISSEIRKPSPSLNILFSVTNIDSKEKDNFLDQMFSLIFSSLSILIKMIERAPRASRSHEYLDQFLRKVPSLLDQMDRPLKSSSTTIFCSVVASLQVSIFKRPN